MKFGGWESLPGVGHFACGFPFRGGAFGHAAFPFRVEHFACGRCFPFRDGAFWHAAGVFPSGMEHFGMRQVFSLPGWSILACGRCFPFRDGAFWHAAGARRGSIRSCEGHRPLLALHPSRPRRCSALWNVLLCWRGDGFDFVGCCRLCQKTGNRPATRAAFPSGLA